LRCWSRRAKSAVENGAPRERRSDTLNTSTIDELLARAAEMCANARFDQAANVLADALREDQNLHAVRYQLSQVQAQLGDLVSAERLVREAALAGGDAYARGVGYILGRLGKLQEAETWLLRALRHDARDALAYADLAAVYGDQRQLSQALACLEHALSIQPDFPWASSTRDSILKQQAFLSLVRETYGEFARRQGLDADPDAVSQCEIEFPSAALRADGSPRFLMTIPSSLIVRDLGAAHLFYREVAGQGYEFALRRLLDLLLHSDDVFIDVGAHWGVHSLSAATLLPNELSVIALEANPENSRRLARWVDRNHLGSDIEVIQNAVGDREGIARLRLNGSSMGHRIGADGLEVNMTTLDKVLADRDWLRWRRVVLKVDVEGYELEVFAGAQQLFSKCQVAAVIWEKSEFHEASAQIHRTSKILEFLSVRGFRHYRFEDETRAASLIPLTGTEGPCNVFSVKVELGTRQSARTLETASFG
jgi:FkbM family methyltransferase